MPPLARACLLLLLTVAAAASPRQAPPARATEPLPEQGYVWMPQRSPQGPTTIVIGLREQRAYVYRNGVRIGIARVSTGKRGHETPTGVFTILEKRREHFSNRYDNAPMPFMQRLTWDGVALHAGNVPPYPASHGCIRLPYAFSELLFGITIPGMAVIVSDAAAAPEVVDPGLFAADAPVSGIPAADAVAVLWAPERAASGPITVVLSARDREIVVLRNAVEIGHAPVAVADGLLQGTRVYLLLEGRGPEASAVVPGRPALRWLAVPVTGTPATSPDDVRRWLASGQLGIDPAFAAQIYEVLTPGATLVVTDEALHPAVAPNVMVLHAERLAPAPAPPP